MPGNPQNQIREDTFIVYVHDWVLSAAFSTLGIELRLDPPYTHRVEAGRDVWTFNHHPLSGCKRWNAQALLKQFSQPDFPEWRKANQDHPFVVALDMAENIQKYFGHIREDIPFVGFYIEDKRYWVKYGSEKHRKCKEQGYKQL